MKTISFYFRKHASLCEINTKVLEALQMYHNLMKETPAPYAFKPLPYTAPLPQGQPMVSMCLVVRKHASLCEINTSVLEAGQSVDGS